MLMHLTLLLRNTTTTMLALFPFHLTFSLLCVLCRMWTTSQPLLARRYLCNARSHSTSCASGSGMSACGATRLLSACLMFISCTTPNRRPCLTSALHCVAKCRNATTRRAASSHVSLLPCRFSVGPDGPRCSHQTAPPPSRCSKDVTTHPHQLGVRPGRPCSVPACTGRHRPARTGSTPRFGTGFFR